jgi:hypothetical protein
LMPLPLLPLFSPLLMLIAFHIFDYYWYWYCSLRHFTLFRCRWIGHCRDYDIIADITLLPDWH